MNAAQKMKFSIRDFFSKCDQIYRRKIYRRTPMTKCDFNKVAKQLY